MRESLFLSQVNRVSKFVRLKVSAFTKDSENAKSSTVKASKKQSKQKTELIPELGRYLLERKYLPRKEKRGMLLKFLTMRLCQYVSRK